MTPATDTDNKSRSRQTLEIDTDPITISESTGVKKSGLGKSTYRKYAAEGRFRTVKIGRRRMTIYASLKAFLENGTGA